MASAASLSTVTAYVERPVLSATSAMVIPSSLSRSRSRMPSFTIRRDTWNTTGAQAIHSALACASRAERRSSVYALSSVGERFISYKP